MKRILHLLLLVACLYSWKLFVDQAAKLEKLHAEYEQMHNEGADEDELARKGDELSSAKSLRIANGLLLTFLTAGVLGILVVVYLLPLFAHKVTHSVYGSNEQVEKDPMRDAHSLLAQGEYEGAIEAFKLAAEMDPTNRLPWVEIAKIQFSHLNNPAWALKTLREALEGQDWPVDDAAFFMFRIAEIYDEAFGDSNMARGIIQQVIDTFPQTRHSANATHRLKEWDARDQEAARHAEEKAFMARNLHHGPGEER